jgi:hypothetical protein
MFSNLIAAIGVEVGAPRKLIRYTMQQIKRQTLRNVTDIPIMRSFPANKNKQTPCLSPRANCTDRATAACRRSDSQLLRI